MNYEKRLREQNKYSEKEIMNKIMNYKRIQNDIKKKIDYLDSHDWMNENENEGKINRDKFIYWIEEEIDLDCLYMMIKSHKRLFTEINELLNDL